VFDITQISAVIAAAGVLIGVLYYALQMRHQEKIRKTDLVVSLYSTWVTKEFSEATLKTWNLDSEGYDDFVRKYGPWFSDTEVYADLRMVGNFFELLSILLSTGLVDFDMVLMTFGIAIEKTWKKLEPLIGGGRKAYGPYLYYNFEYLYNRVKERQQRQ